MGDRLEKAKDCFHAAIDGGRDFLGDLLGEAILALLACGVLVLVWWSFGVAPYVTVSIGAGVLLLAAYGAIAYVREIRGTRLVRRLTMAAMLTVGIVVFALTYLPYCACLG